MIWIEHFLFVLLLVAGPLWDYFKVPGLKTDPSRKVPFYWQIIGSEWPVSAVVLLVAGPGLWRAPAALPWQSPHTKTIFWGFLAGLAIVMCLPFLGLLKAKTRASVRKALDKVAFILPANRREDFWFGFLAITAGICEEWLFRGFLLHYLVASPWHLSIVVAIILSSGIFGLNHLYQGLSGMGASAVTGAIFAVIYLATGSLLVVMIVHSLVDLRALFLVMGSREREGEALA